MFDNLADTVFYALIGVLAYVIVSNTLFFLLGARLLQILPGVTSGGFKTTLRLAITLAACLLAIAYAISRVPDRLMRSNSIKRESLKDIETFVMFAARRFPSL